MSLDVSHLTALSGFDADLRRNVGASDKGSRSVLAWPNERGKSGFLQVCVAEIFSFSYIH